MEFLFECAVVNTRSPIQCGCYGRADFAPTITKKPATMNHQFTAISYSLDVLFYKVFFCRLKNTFSSCVWVCARWKKTEGSNNIDPASHTHLFIALQTFYPFWYPQWMRISEYLLSTFLEADRANILLKLSLSGSWKYWFWPTHNQNL